MVPSLKFHLVSSRIASLESQGLSESYVHVAKLGGLVLYGNC